MNSAPPQWFVTLFLLIVICFLFLALYWTANKILGMELHHLYSIFKSEWEDSRKGRRTVGAMNWRGFMVLVVFGVIVMIFTSSQKLVGILGIVMGIAKTEDLVKATNFFTLIYFLGGFLMLSMLCVIADNKARAKASK